MRHALLLVGGLSLLAPLGSLLGALDWRLELFGHFLPHAGVALLLAALAAQPVWLRLGFALVGLASLAHVLLVLGSASPAQPDPQAGTLRVLSVNLNLDNPEMAALIAQVQDLQPDLLLLIEVTPSQWRALAPLRQGFAHGCSRPQDGPFGMALLSRLPLQACTVEGQPGMPVIVATLSGTPLTLVGLHPPPPLNGTLAALRQAQLRHWGERLTGRSEGLLLGDLNLTPWSPLYRDLLARTGLHDARAGRGYFATWPATLGAFGLPLDQALLGADWQARALHSLPVAGSDHRALLLDLAVGAPGEALSNRPRAGPFAALGDNR
ncbi:MAG: endonuclease/exonuclease/phosphatase family protein [Pseudomonadota bacterium]